VGSEIKNLHGLYIYIYIYICTFIYMYISLYPDQDQPVVNNTACPRTHDARFLDHVIKRGRGRKQRKEVTISCVTRTETNGDVKSSVHPNNEKRNHLPIGSTYDYVARMYCDKKKLHVYWSFCR